MRATLLTILLALSAPTAFAGPTDRHDGVPDAGERLTVARELAGSAVNAEEAHDALTALLDVPAVSADARQALVALCIREDARPGWLGTYAVLQRDPFVSRSDADTLGLRSLEAWIWLRAGRADARERLAARQIRDPYDTEVRFYIATSWMLDGRPERALPLYALAPEDPESAEGARLARLALDRSASDRAGRVRAIAEGGYPDLAAVMLRRDDPRRTDAAAWRTLGEIQAERGRAGSGIATLEQTLRRHPGDIDLRVALVRTLLAAGKSREARRAAAGVREAAALVAATASATADPGSAAALVVAVPGVVRTRARRLLAAGDAVGAWASLEPVMRVPTRETLELYTRTGLAAGMTEGVLAAWRLEAVRASGPLSRRKLAGALADVYSRVGEVEKGRGATDAAVRAYRVSLAIEPDHAGHLAGLGGILWSAGRLADAHDAFARASRMMPGDVGLLACLAELDLALGDPAAALATLARGPTYDPRLQALAVRARSAVTVARLDASLAEQPAAARHAALQRAAQVYRDDPDVIRALAERFAARGDAEDALNAWTRLAALAPKDGWARVGTSRALAALRRFPEARAALDDARALGVDEEALTLAYAEVGRAEGDHLWRDEHRDRDALEAYRRALAAHPEGWTLTALGGLYLSHGQFDVARAFLRAATEADPDNTLAWSLTAQALAASGHPGEARALLAEKRTSDVDGSLLRAVEAAERLGAIAEAERRADRGEWQAARRDINDLVAAHPGAADARVAAGFLDLRLGDSARAQQQGIEALRLDPTSTSAMLLCVEAGRTGAGMEAAIEALERARPLGGGDAVSPFVSRARLAVAIDAAVHEARAGHQAYARVRMGKAEDAAADRPILWNDIAAGWRAMDAFGDARRAWMRALAVDPRNADAILGIAALSEADGRRGEARRWLRARFDEAPDPRVGRELARLAADAGAWQEASRALTTLPARQSAEALPVIALPSGETPVVGDESSGAAMSVAVAPGSIADPDRLLTHARAIDGQAVGGLVHRTGDPGFGALTADMAGATFEHALFGPLRAEISAVGLSLHDGVRDVEGVGAAIGVSTAPGSTWGADLAIGTSPLGFSAPYLTWSGAATLRPDRHFDLALTTARVPITDSLASWAGASDASGDFGGVAETSVGAAVHVHASSAVEAGIGGRLATLDAPGMASVARRAVDGWASRRFGGEERSFGVGVSGSVLSHDHDVGGFMPGSGGVFSPGSFVTGFGHLDGRVRAGGVARVCGGIAAGVEDVRGASAGDTFVAPGTHPAFGARIGASLRLGGQWDAGVNLRHEMVGAGWSQQAGMAWLSWRQDAGAPAAPALPGIHGEAPAGTSRCD